MKRILLVLLLTCAMASVGIAATKSTPADQEENGAVLVKPATSPTKTIRPAATTGTKVPQASPIKPATRTEPGVSTKSRTSPLAKPGISPLTRPVTATLPSNPTTGPIIDSIIFNGHDPAGNLRWTATVRNALTTEYTFPLWVSAQQCRTIQAGVQCDGFGNVLVTPSPLAPGQSTQVSGSFARYSGYTHLKSRLKSGATSLHEREVPLPPELSYQAQIVNINITNDVSNPVHIQVQNTGANAIPVFSVQKLCAHTSTPTVFNPCGGQALNNLLPNQTVTANTPLPSGWPSNPNIMKVRVTRGLTVLDEEIFNAP